MKIIALLAILAPLASASVTIATSTTSVSIRVASTVSAAGYTLAGYQAKSGACPAAASLAYRTASNQASQAGAGGVSYNMIAGLAPSTTYCVAGYNITTAEWSSVSEVTTDAYTGAFPQAPTPATELSLPGVPAVTGNTYTVASDCSDLQSKLNTAASLSGSLVHQVVIPAGSVCTASYWNFPYRSAGGTGYIIVRTSTPDAQLPPEGVRYDPAIWPKALLATVRTNACTFLQASAAGRFTDQTNNWRLIGIEITADYENACNGLKTISSITAGNPTTIVTSSAHGMSTGSLARVYSAPGITGLTGTTYSVTVTNSTTFTVAASTTGTYTSGGKVFPSDPAYGSGNYLSLVAVSDAGSYDIYFDRCYIHGEDWPYRTFIGMLLQGTRIGVFNSYLEKIAYPYLVVSGTNSPANSSEKTPVSIDLTECRVCRVHNSYISASGFAVFGQSDFDSPAQTSQDHVIDSNTITVLPGRMYRSDGLNASSDGHYYIMRQPLEWKQIQRLTVRGNDISGTYYSAAAPGPSINLSMRGNDGTATGSPSSIDNVIIKDNIIRDGSGGIEITGEDDRPTQVQGLTQKILIENNLFYGLNAEYYRTTVAGGTSYFGHCFWLVSTLSDVAINRNTCWMPAGRGPMTLLFGMNRSGSLQFTGNILGWTTYPNGGNTFGAVYYDQASNMLPVIAGGASSTLTAANFTATLDAYWQRNPAAGWTFTDNVFVPGVKNGGATSATYSSTTLADMWNWYSLCDPTNGVLKDLLAYTNRCAGSNTANDGSETAAQRMAYVGFRDYTTYDFALTSSSPYYRGAADKFRPAGADPALIAFARGTTQQISVTAGYSSITARYLAPDRRACKLSVSSDSGATWTSVADAGGAQRRTVSVSGLTPGTSYAWRVGCYYHQVGTTTGTVTTEAASTMTLSLGYSLNITGATKARVTVYKADGTSAQTTCSSSPCSVAFTKDATEYMLEKLSSGDVVLSAGARQRVVLQ
jgi:hypothetical protein